MSLNLQKVAIQQVTESFEKAAANLPPNLKETPLVAALVTAGQALEVVALEVAEDAEGTAGRLDPLLGRTQALLSEAQSEVSGLQEEREQLKKKVDEEKERHRLSERCLKEVTNHKNSFENQLTQSKRNAAELQAVVTEQDRKLEAMETTHTAEMDGLKKSYLCKLADAAKSLDESKSKTEEANRKQVQAERNEKTAKDQLEQSKKRQDAAEKTLSEKKSEVRNLEDEVKAGKEDNDKLRGEVVHLTAQLKEKIAQLEHQSDVLLTLQAARNDMRDAFSNSSFSGSDSPDLKNDTVDSHLLMDLEHPDDEQPSLGPATPDRTLGAALEDESLALTPCTSKGWKEIQGAGKEVSPKPGTSKGWNQIQGADKEVSPKPGTSKGWNDIQGAGKEVTPNPGWLEEERREEVTKFYLRVLDRDNELCVALDQLALRSDEVADGVLQAERAGTGVAETFERVRQHERSSAELFWSSKFVPVRDY